MDSTLPRSGHNQLFDPHRGYDWRCQELSLVSHAIAVYAGAPTTDGLPVALVGKGPPRMVIPSILSHADKVRINSSGLPLCNESLSTMAAPLLVFLYNLVQRGTGAGEGAR
jgi:hypothetical protein